MTFNLLSFAVFTRDQVNASKYSLFFPCFIKDLCFYPSVLCILSLNFQQFTLLSFKTSLFLLPNL